MKNDIIIPILREEDFVAANKRRDKYALARDLQALENNVAIADRLLSVGRNLIKCEKCGKEFSAVLTSKDSLTCSECK